MRYLTTIISLFVVIALLGLMTISLHERGFITPINYKQYSLVTTQKEDKLVTLLLIMGAKKENVQKISNGIKLAEQVTGVKPKMTVAIICSESEFNKNARSKKGYKGLMQTPVKTDYEEVDILYGAMIFKEKLAIANGDVLKGLVLYKGGDNPEAWKEARKTMALYNKIQYEG